jgi:Arm DNA-binding domain
VRKTLSDRAIKALKPASKPYIRSDGIVPKLGLRVMPSGHKTFVLVSRFPGSRNPVPRALGAYGALTLAEARAKAREWLELIATGKGRPRRKSVSGTKTPAVRQTPLRGWSRIHPPRSHRPRS